MTIIAKILHGYWPILALLAIFASFSSLPWYLPRITRVSPHEKIARRSIYRELSFLNGRRPPVFVYNFSEDVRIPKGKIDWPHAGIDFAFYSQLQNSQLLVRNLEEAQLAFIPVPLGSWYRVSENHLDFRKDESYSRRNDDFRYYWSKLSSMLANVSTRKRVPHFVVFSYMCYCCSFEHIPEDIIILTFERFSVTGVIHEGMANAGCAMRCIVIPYFTVHSSELKVQKPLDLKQHLERRLLLSVFDIAKRRFVKSLRV